MKSLQQEESSNFCKDSLTAFNIQMWLINIQISARQESIRPHWTFLLYDFWMLLKVVCLRVQSHTFRTNSRILPWSFMIPETKWLLLTLCHGSWGHWFGSEVKTGHRMPIRPPLALEGALSVDVQLADWGVFLSWMQSKEELVATMTEFLSTICTSIMELGGAEDTDATTKRPIVLSTRVMFCRTKLFSVCIMAP